MVTVTWQEGNVTVICSIMLILDGTGIGILNGIATEILVGIAIDMVVHHGAMECYK